ncbi:hypothetical protein POPTR_001G020250v4 [Populus trichocarpa]|uniref:Uncharacterized protein n=1 Tax=Populus trichocarpa TaxID=3694 RepID=A0ACC0TGH4_POPTR|nr:hypothetical protein BDE02_01G019400 [Populus trichocarpa]KAI9400685.1 hypothetical protein POPTR_001G020250v4 [Populus trichocarpa]
MLIETCFLPFLSLFFLPCERASFVYSLLQVKLLSQPQTLPTNIKERVLVAANTSTSSSIKAVIFLPLLQNPGKGR